VAAWRQVTDSEPEFAKVAQGLLDAHTHKTLATLRTDGSPRISGTEAWFAAGELWFGSMWRSRKALDLIRDPRFALHSASADPPDWQGDAKIDGRVEEVSDEERMAAALAEREGDPPPGTFHLFRAEIRSVVLVRLSEARNQLVIELWREGEPLRRMQRD
jgi:hypothetical protein